MCPRDGAQNIGAQWRPADFHFSAHGKSAAVHTVRLRGRYLDFPTRAFWRAKYMDDTYLMAVRARRADPTSGKQTITDA